MNVTGIVLAGGQSRRMNHQDKAWLNFDGAPLIVRVISRIKNSVDGIIVSCNSNDPAYASLGYELIEDVDGGYQGPLAGIFSCALHVKTEFSFIVPCDTPNLPIDLTHQLHEKIGDHDAVIVEEQGMQHPLILFARTSTLMNIDTHLAAGNRSVKSWLRTISFETLHFESGSDDFININRPDQLLPLS